MNILQKIVRAKKSEIALLKNHCPEQILERSPLYKREPVSLKRALEEPNQEGIIAEFKRRSPSRGWINQGADPVEIGLGYLQAGVTALSILTDHQYFGGNAEDFIALRKSAICPLLRKDFILDEYQVVESKSMGADVILLIAAILTPEKTVRLAQLAANLGMETLLEIHAREELSHYHSSISMVGVNSRNLDNFSVNLHTALQLIPDLPENCIAIAESGIRNPKEIIRLRNAGYKGFLIGESFMHTGNPEIACKRMIQNLKQFKS